MNTKATIRKILFILLWVSIGGGMLTLLVAAIGKKNKENCTDYTISIKGTGDNYFIDKDDVFSLLKTATGSSLKGKKITEINLDKLEQLLKDNIWVYNAELWFDNRNVLHVEVLERVPVARVFTNSGNSFYIDSARIIMPLSDKMRIRLPMFTGFPDKKILDANDSSLLSDVKNIAQFINHDKFWTSQVAQININEDKEFELSPVVGNHLIILGNGKDLEKKFNRLMVFYQQVLTTKGFDAYSTIDVQYAGQVVGTKCGVIKNKVNTVQLKKNIDEMLKQVQKQYDSIVDIKPITEKPTINGDAKVSTNDLRATSTQSTNPNAMKAESLPIKTDEVPKAVMPKREGN